MYKTAIHKNLPRPSLEVFSTEDFNLAATLIVVGAFLIKLDKSNPRRFKFVFRARKNLDQIIESYWNDQCMVSSLSLFNAQKALKSRIFGR